MPSVALHSLAVDAGQHDLVNYDLDHLKVKCQTHLAPVVSDGTAQCVAAAQSTTSSNCSLYSQVSSALINECMNSQRRGLHRGVTDTRHETWAAPRCYRHTSRDEGCTEVLQTRVTRRGLHRGVTDTRHETWAAPRCYRHTS